MIRIEGECDQNRRGVRSEQKGSAIRIEGECDQNRRGVIVETIYLARVYLFGHGFER